MTWWNNKTLGVIGLGNMGHAIAKGVAESGLLEPGALLGYDPRAEQLDLHEEIELTANVSELAEQADVLVVAVKPYAVGSVLRRALRENHVTGVISVAAGLPLIEVLKAVDGKADGVVRAMPNIAASVQASCTAIVGSESTDPKFVDAAELLFGCVGTVVRLAEESAMHGFTGAVGSGIAYGFVFAEALADACVAEGLSRSVSRRAAASVLRGAAELLLDDESVNPAERKDAVCSPGGTTIEGVAKLEELGFRSAVIQAVRTAARRSRSLQGDDDE